MRYYIEPYWDGNTLMCDWGEVGDFVSRGGKHQFIADCNDAIFVRDFPSADLPDPSALMAAFTSWQCGV